MDIGKRVRSAREARGMTQEELARRAGVPLNRVGRIETGTVTDPHYSTLTSIAGGLDVSVGELLEEPVPFDAAPEAGPNVETPQELSLLDDPQIVDWLLEQDLTWGTTEDEAFKEHVRGLSLEKLDGEGRPLAVMELGRDLADEQDSARDLLWTKSKYRSLGKLLSVDKNAPVAEQKNQRHDQLSKLRMDLDRRYRRRAYALRRYAELVTELLAAQKKLTTVSSTVQPRQIATTPEDVLDKAFLEKVA